MQAPTTQRRDYIRGVIAIIAASMLWGLSGLFVRSIATADPWQINGYRALSMTATVFVFLVAVYGRKTWERFATLDRRAMAVVALFFALGTTLYIVAVSKTLVANVACLTATAPIFAAVLARLLLGERSGPTVWIATALAVAGIAVIFRDQVGMGDISGNLVSIVVAFCFASQTVALRKYRAVDVLPAMCVGGALVFALLPLIHGGYDIPRHDLPLILVMGVVQLGIPIILFVRGARHVPAIQIALISLLDMLFNPLFTWLGAGEVPSPSAVAGGGLIVAGVLIVILMSRRPATVPAAALRPARE